MRQSGSEAIFEVLRQEIIAGDLAPEEQLREVELAERLEVSRTPVREALRLLFAERLVTRRPTGGFTVAPLDATEMRNICDVRAVLEGLAARQAARTISTADMQTLDELVNQMELLQSRPEEVARLGSRFHLCIQQAAGNSWLQDSLDGIRGHIDRYRRVSTASAGRPEVAVKEHRLIYNALAAADPDIAEQAMRNHIDRGSAVAIERAFGGS